MSSVNHLSKLIAQNYSNAQMEQSWLNSAAIYAKLVGPEIPAKPLTKRQKLAKRKKEIERRRLQRAHDRLCKRLGGCCDGDY